MSLETLLGQYLSEKPDREKWVRTVVGIFIEHGIQQPTEDDYKGVFRTSLQGRGIKGKSSYYNYKKAGEDFYEWLSRKGDKMMSENEVKEAEGISENESTGAVPEEKPEKRKGRPKKAGSVETKQICIYMPTSTYERMKRLAFFDGISVTDLICKLSELYVQKNIDTLSDNENVFKNMKKSIY